MGDRRTGRSLLGNMVTAALPWGIVGASGSLHQYVSTVSRRMEETRVRPFPVPPLSLRPASSSKSLPSGSTVTSLSRNATGFTTIVESVWTTETVNGSVVVATMTAVNTITTSLVPSTTTSTSSTLGITTTVIKGISHATAPNLGGVAGLAGVAAAFAGML